jgi:hypothetical protein
MEEEVIEVEGWKGQGTTEVINEGDTVLLRQWHKSKATGERYPEEHRFPKKNVDILLDIIKTHCVPREEYKPYYIWRKIIERYKLNDLSFMGVDKEALKEKFGNPEMVDKILDEIAPLIIYEAFDGKKLRSLFYFPLYYFPLMVLRRGDIQYVADLEKIIMYLGD